MWVVFGCCFVCEKSLRVMSERFNKKTEECCYDSCKLLVAVDLASGSWLASFDSCSQTADVFIWSGLLSVELAFLYYTRNSILDLVFNEESVR